MMLKEMFTMIAVKEQSDGTAVIFCLLNSLDDYTLEGCSAIEIWGSEIDLVLSEFKGDRLILDFSDVYKMTSKAISMLLALHFNAKKRHIVIMLRGLNEYILHTFRMTCLDHVFLQAEETGQDTDNLFYPFADGALLTDSAYSDLT